MKRFSTVLLTVAGTCLATSLVLHAEDKAVAPATQPAADAAGMEMAAAMEAWMKFATPGEPHAELAEMVGEWDVMMEDYSSGEKMEFPGTARFEMILGGRYLQQTMNADFMGMPFEGIGLTGYDNLRKVYIDVWLDNVGTSIFTSEGTAQPDGSVVAHGKMTQPDRGGAVDTKTVYYDKADKHVFEMYRVTDGKDVLQMRATYSKKQ
jgi:hypothetical protein